MEISNKVKAEILSKALPYIQKYHKKVVVIKYGGNAMVSDELKKTVIEDIVLLQTVGVRVVLVHGGGPSINETLKKMNIESSFVDGLRVTDKATSDVVQMVLSGKVNKDLVRKICHTGGQAIGVSGIDGGMLKCQPLDDKHGYVGKIIDVNLEIIHKILDNNYIPVLSSIGYDASDNTYNINADTVASTIAAKLNADALILLTDVAGLMKKVDNELELISRISVQEIEELKNNGEITGGMIPKINCVIQALKNGVGSVFMIDGRISHSILIEMLTDQGLGTMFTL